MPRRTSRSLSLAEARRLALASQGFASRPASPGVSDIRRLIARIHAFQIDSVNVVVRAHYVPAFARFGAYPTAALDSLAYRRRELFEYWGHAACLMPVSLYPLLRYRMDGDGAREYMASPRGAYVAKVYQEVAARGPLAAAGLSEPGARSGKWWGWGTGKSALEYLYDAGLLAIAGRRGFERLYDLAERVIPAAARETTAPPREEAMKQLICLGAKACGAGTFADVAGYLCIDGWHDRRPRGPCWEWPKGAGRAKPIGARLMAELVEEGRLVPVAIEGWKEPAFLHPDARVPPRPIGARALVTPFDSLVWERGRMARLFGMAYSIELYTPPEKRVFGYYVFPFLMGDALVARCDLKADRERGVLMARSAHLEPRQPAARVAGELAAELVEMSAWLGLRGVEVGRRGDLAAALRRAVAGRRPS
ncbi:MAG TPA: crosslink repair DNA glycosylase YcaQ family protein [Vicinamibacterales bacterium]|nr:crosslink repair DNA glycosylase YcaQ family protein [Vicinamibacterales bacterium]